MEIMKSNKKNSIRTYNTDTDANTKNKCYSCALEMAKNECSFVIHISIPKYAAVTGKE